jgi:hypothetical protein
MQVLKMNRKTNPFKKTAHGKGRSIQGTRSEVPKVSRKDTSKRKSLTKKAIGGMQWVEHGRVVTCGLTNL